MNVVKGIFTAEFKERSRRFSFISMIALALFAAFWFVPRNDNSMQIMLIQPDRFVQAGHPSWIPIASAWGLGFFLPLIGFFYMKNLISQDKPLGLTQLVQSSPISNVRYIFGKWLAGIALLYSTTAVVVVGSFAMMLLRFPRQSLSVYDFLSPFAYLLIVIPFFLSAAVLFDSIRFLRGAFGSVVFIGAFLTVYILQALSENSTIWMRFFDLSGATIIVGTIKQAVLEQSGLPMDTMLFLGSSNIETFAPTQQLIFHGTHFAAEDFIGLAGMLGISVCLVLLSAPILALSTKSEAIKLAIPNKAKRIHESQGDFAHVNQARSTRINEPAVYLPIQNAGQRARLLNVKGEFVLMLSGQTVFWRFVALGGIVASVFVPIGTAQTILLPLLMIWFINIFSAMGSREYQYDFLKMIVINPHGVLRQMLSAWLSGVLLTLLVASPVILRLCIAGNEIGTFACIAGAVFIPSLALFLGEMTKTRRVFEMIIIVITYIALNNLSALMYFGDPQNTSLAIPVMYLIVGLGMGAAAVGKRIAF